MMAACCSLKSAQPGRSHYTVSNVLLSHQLAFTAGSAVVQAAAFAGLNGVGLALVLPCVQSILAEVYPAGRRGLAFGLVMTAGVLGAFSNSAHILGLKLYKSCTLAGRA